MKTTIDMAREAGGRAQQNKNCDVEYLMSADALKAFEALVRADERNRTWTQEHWTEYERSIANQAVMTEQKRIVNLLMIQHEAAKGTHNYWHVAANLIQAEVASDT
jgi:hypothetical protein